MALVQCPECGREVSDQTPTCRGCGVPIRRESKVVVHGYTQMFAHNPPVRVFWDGEEVGSVAEGGALTVEAPADGFVSFKCNLRKANVPVKAGSVAHAKLSWDRITGKLVPQVVDTATPGL
jgi:hypothetical protein